MTGQGSLRSKAFQRYWRAGAVSGLGSYLTVFSLQALVVLVLHGGAAEVGWLNAARWLPYLVFGLLVGALVDGRRRLPLMVGTDLAQAALLLTIPLLWWQDALSLPALMLIVVLAGTAAVINGAADMSFLPRMLERQHLQRAHARIDATDAAASTTGPALGGLLVVAVGAPRWLCSLTHSRTCTPRSRCAESASTSLRRGRVSPRETWSARSRKASGGSTGPPA